VKPATCTNISKMLHGTMKSDLPPLPRLEKDESLVVLRMSFSNVMKLEASKEAKDLSIGQAGVSKRFSPSGVDIDSATQRLLRRSIRSLD